MAPEISSGRTEIEGYNGHLIRRAKEVSCPIKRGAFGRVGEIVRERLPPRREHLRYLAETLPKGVWS